VQSAAIDWLLRISENPEAGGECLAWRMSDPLHEQAWVEAMATWEATGMVGSLDREDWREEIEEVRRQAVGTRRVQWGVAMAASIVAVMFLGWFMNLPDARYSTETAQVETIAMRDGSQLTLGAASEVELHFGGDERRVVLNGGQAFFEVAKDKDRPFTVVAGEAEIRVTGTKFDVHRNRDAVTVSVLEGRLEVRRQQSFPFLEAEHPARILTAGLRSRLAEGSASFTRPEKAVIPAGDWRSGRFFYHDVSLSDIASDLSRYSETPVRIADAQASQIKVTTSFEVGAIPDFLNNLTETLPLVQTRDADGTITLESRPNIR